MRMRNLVVGLLFVTVVAPILLYTDRLATFTTSSYGDEFVEDVTTVAFNGRSRAHLNVLPRESSSELKEPLREVFADNNTSTTSGNGGRKRDKERRGVEEGR